MIFERLATHDEVLAFVDGQRPRRRVQRRRAPAAGPSLALRAGAASLRLGGVTHLVTQRHGRPYQGYPGPGWSTRGAGARWSSRSARTRDGDGAGRLLRRERLLASACCDVPVRAREIQRRLDRMVWNGRIHQAAESNAFSRSLLEEIAATGRRTKDVFERASARAAGHRGLGPAGRGALPGRPVGGRARSQPLRTRQRLPLVGDQPGARDDGRGRRAQDAGAHQRPVHRLRRTCCCSTRKAS